MSLLKLCVLALLTMCSIVLAVPQLINYQGNLARPNGTPLDTTVAMTFSLYFDAGGVNLLLADEACRGRGRRVICRSPWRNYAFHGCHLEVVPRSSGALPLATTSNDPACPARSRWLTPIAVGTVDGATAARSAASSMLARGNTNAGTFANVFGENNTASGQDAVISGVSGTVPPIFERPWAERGDQATSSRATVGGGENNQASNIAATVAGGTTNIASNSVCHRRWRNAQHGFRIVVNRQRWFNEFRHDGQFSTISGGQSNMTNGDFATISVAGRIR